MTVGEDVELDVRVLDGVADALRHLVTNAVDHGCERPAERHGRRQGRARPVTVDGPRRPARPSSWRSPTTAPGSTRHRCASRAIERGLLAADSTAVRRRAADRCCSKPGFSTRDDVTETSGRGVGLDVVRTAVEELGGTVEVDERARRRHALRAHPAGDARGDALPASRGSATSSTRCRCPGSSRPCRWPTPGARRRRRQHDAYATARRCPSADLGEALGVVRGARSPRWPCCSGAAGRDRWPGPSTPSRASARSSSRPLGEFLGRYPGVGRRDDRQRRHVMLLVDLRELALHRSPRRCARRGRGQAGRRPAAAPHRAHSRRARGQRAAAGADKPGTRRRCSWSRTRRRARAAARDPRGRRLHRHDRGRRPRRRLPVAAEPGRPRPVRRRDAGHGRLHADPHDPPDPRLGERAGRDHDVAR